MKRINGITKMFIGILVLLIFLLVYGFERREASGDINLLEFAGSPGEASTAIAIDSSFMFVGDNEDQIIRLYSRTKSGSPELNGMFDFTNQLKLEDIDNGLPREVDIEASTRVGDRIFWLGSHSNGGNNSNDRPNRERLFATDISGSGKNATLTFVGFFTELEIRLFEWEDTIPQAGRYDLHISAAPGINPEADDGSGFNIEGLARAPDGQAYYIGFRAPLVPKHSRHLALIAPAKNLEDLVCAPGGGEPCPGPDHQNIIFGPPIELNLDRRGIRSIECNDKGCLIVAGPPGEADTTRGAKSVRNRFHLYTWDGNPDHRPEPRTAPLNLVAPNFNPEGIVSLPDPLDRNSLIQLVSDDGNGKFRSATVELGDVVENGLFPYLVNNMVTFDIIPSTRNTIDCRKTGTNCGCPVDFEGKFTFTARLTNKASILTN